jgi:ubiquinol-cytochrome c reductase cytochrome b subunit
VCLQLLRLFFTGAFRRPRGLTCLIWVSLLQGVLESIPLAGTHLMLWVFGGAVPGHRIIPRLYWLHVLLPAAMAGVLALRRRLVRRHGHPRFWRTGLARLGYR